MKEIENNLLGQARNIYEHFELKEDLTACLDCKKRSTEYSFLKSFLDYIELRRREVESGNLTLETLRMYQKTYKLVSKFIEEDFQESDLSLKLINYGFIMKFNTWLLINTDASSTSRTNYQIPLKVFLDLKQKEWIIQSNPFDSIRFRRPKKQIVYLTEREINSFRQFESGNISLIEVRDIFLFMYNTGLSYKDCFQLEVQNLLVHGGYEVVSGKRSKTGVEFMIPLTFEAKYLIKKYKNHKRVINNSRIFPSFDKSLFNKKLKLIAIELGLKKRVSSHVARHSFATTALIYGVPITTIQKVLGHSDIKSTLIYANLVDLKVYSDMESFNIGVLRQMSTSFSEAEKKASKKIELNIEDMSWLSERLAENENNNRLILRTTSEHIFYKNEEHVFLDMMKSNVYMVWCFLRLAKRKMLFKYDVQSNVFNFSLKEIEKYIYLSATTMHSCLTELGDLKLIQFDHQLNKRKGYQIKFHGREMWINPIRYELNQRSILEYEYTKSTTFEITDFYKELHVFKNCRPNAFRLLYMLRILSKECEVHESINDIAIFSKLPQHNIWRLLKNLEQNNLLKINRSGKNAFRIFLNK